MLAEKVKSKSAIIQIKNLRAFHLNGTKQKALDRTTKATKKKMLSFFLKENAWHKEREDVKTEMYSKKNEARVGRDLAGWLTYFWICLKTAPAS